MSQEHLAIFCHLVLQDLSLQERLQETSDRGTFLNLVCQLGAERGYSFTKTEVETQLRASRQAWFQRFVCR